MDFLSFAKHMGKNIGKNTSESLSVKYSQKLLDHAKQAATDALKTSKRVIQKTAEASSYLIGNKIANQIIKIQEDLQENNSEAVINEDDKEIPKKRYISPEEIQDIIDELRSI